MDELLRQILKLPDINVNEEMWRYICFTVSEVEIKTFPNIRNALLELKNDPEKTYSNVTSTEALLHYFNQWLIVSKVSKNYFHDLTNIWLEHFKTDIPSDDLITLTAKFINQPDHILLTLLNKLDKASWASTGIAGYALTTVYSAIFSQSSRALQSPFSEENEDKINFIATVLKTEKYILIYKKRCAKYLTELSNYIHDTIKANDRLAYQHHFKKSGMLINNIEAIEDIIEGLQFKNNTLKDINEMRPLLIKYQFIKELQYTLNSENPDILKKAVELNMKYQQYQQTFKPLHDDYAGFFKSFSNFIGLSSFIGAEEEAFYKTANTFDRWVRNEVNPVYETSNVSLVKKG